MAQDPFFISKEDLSILINHFENSKPENVKNKQLRGFSFREGKDKNGEDALFPDAVYSDDPLSKDLLRNDPTRVTIENEEIAVGCPNPPGYTIDSANNESDS